MQTCQAKRVQWLLIGALALPSASVVYSQDQGPLATEQAPDEPLPPALRRAVDERVNELLSTREKAKWEQALERLSLQGDMRLRHESDFELDSQSDRNRERIRLRLGANYRLTDEILLGSRLSTGNPADPNSPHVTMGNVFRRFDVSADRAFFAYRPGNIPGARLTLGKFGHPFYQNPIYGELVWDADVQPEGALLDYRLAKLGALEQLDLFAGAYSVLEQAAEHDAAVGVFQAAGRLRLAVPLALDAALGYYLWSDQTPENATTVLADNAGNALVDRNRDGKTDDFRTRFGILNPILALTYSGWRLPLSFSGEYVSNTRAGGQHQGYAVGAALGQAQRKGDWRFYYQWQVIEQDAVLSPFSQDDFLFQTNHRSHVLGLNYQVVDPVGIHLWGLVSARDETSPGPTTGSDHDQWRGRLDLNIKF